jgi:hypothetical protein
LELIECLASLRDEKLNITLTMVTSLYREGDNSFLMILNRKIKELNLGKFVSIHFDYKQDKDSLALLSESDLIVLPYQATKESSSASVRHCFASGVPVAITPNNIFEDIEGLAYVLPGSSPSLLKIGIKNYLFNKRESLFKDESYVQNWINQHNYTRLSIRLQGLIKGLENNDTNWL